MTQPTLNQVSIMKMEAMLRSSQRDSGIKKAHEFHQYHYHFWLTTPTNDGLADNALLGGTLSVS